MKTTHNFDFVRQKPDRSIISDEWIERVVTSPVKVEYQSDGRVKMWAKINEVGK